MHQGKVKSFLLKHSLFRVIRSFLYSRVFPYSKYVYALVFLGLIGFFCYIYFYNPKFRERIIKYYFNTISSESDLASKVNITGYNHVSRDQILEIINADFDSKHQNDSDLINLKQKIEKLPWVNEVTITRSLPNNLNITIKEFEPFAIWMEDGKKYLINKDGNIITEMDGSGEFDHMMILSGRDANYNVRSLFNILAIDPEVSQNIYSATWVGGRRWDIRFENNLLVKLPESGIKEAWERLIKIYNIPGSLINLNSIDLRIDKKIYLEYNDQTTKEIKSL